MTDQFDPTWPHGHVTRDDRKYFTVVFSGDLTKILGNPFKTLTPFGYPAAVSYGNALEELNKLEEGQGLEGVK